MLALYHRQMLLRLPDRSLVARNSNCWFEKLTNVHNRLRRSFLNTSTIVDNNGIGPYEVTDFVGFFCLVRINIFENLKRTLCMFQIVDWITPWRDSTCIITYRVYFINTRSVFTIRNKVFPLFQKNILKINEYFYVSLYSLFYTVKIYPGHCISIYKSF